MSNVGAFADRIKSYPPYILTALKNKLPGILIMMGGKCDLHEGKGDNIVTHAFSIDFINRDALNAFLNDPVTHPAKAVILDIAEGGYDGIWGFNLEK